MNKTGKKVLFSIILVFIVIASIEAGLRVFYRMRTGRPSHVLPYERAQYIRKILPYSAKGCEAVRKGDFLVANGYYTFYPDMGLTAGGIARINNIGFRGEDYYVDEGAVRIWCLGGSTTFGFGSKRAFSEILQDELNREGGKRYKVLNGGVPGMNGQHIYNMLRDRSFAAKVRPDIVILNTYWNTIEQYENGLLIETIDNRSMQKFLRSWALAFLIYKGYLFLKYNELIGPFQALALYVDRICAMGKRYGFKVMLLNEPMVQDDKAWMAAPERVENHMRAGRLFKRFQERYNDTAVFVPIGFYERFDYKDMDKVNRFFIDKGHLTMEGNEKLVWELAPVIRRLASKRGDRGA
jgi:hypothetical protein